MEYGEGFRRMMFARRKRKGMTQTELGAEVGISQHGISDYECGKTSIPIDDAAAIVRMDMAVAGGTANGAGLRFRAEGSHVGLEQNF